MGYTRSSKQIQRLAFPKVLSNDSSSSGEVQELEFSHVPGVLLPMWTLIAPYCRPNAKGCFEKAKVPNQFSQRLASPSVRTSLACIGSGWLLSIVLVPLNLSFRPSDSQMPSQVQVYFVNEKCKEKRKCT
ncbi:uncharacterized protein G2W53_017468 [Senna tora]|uniref:Uncharacterized protein n=1 Tax=Senna tora TaxID=362788 RepID=A0A834TYI5_9FABA|nr:uncharacterized protein G2W53_017468 [Senna tora]